MAIGDVHREILSEARTAIAQQGVALTSIRERAGQLLNYAGLASAVLGGLLLQHDTARATRWTYTAVGAFLVVALTMVFVNLPREFTFANDARMIVDEWNLADRTDDDIIEHLARYLSEHCDRNEAKLVTLHVAYSVGSLAFAAELLLLLTDLLQR